MVWAPRRATNTRNPHYVYISTRARTGIDVSRPRRRPTTTENWHSSLLAETHRIKQATSH